MIPIRVSASKGRMAGKIPGAREKAASPSMKRLFFL